MATLGDAVLDGVDPKKRRPVPRGLGCVDELFEDLPVSGVRDARHVLEEEPLSVTLNHQSPELIDEGASLVGSSFGDGGRLRCGPAFGTSASVPRIVAWVGPVGGLRERLAGRSADHDAQVATRETCLLP